jgi:ribonuclease H / adenosylcobalamin/alpha-ribazole phosphatase
VSARVHLVRHGEVADPDHVVYASMPGFGLTDVGALQAREAGRYLGRRPVVGVWSSPLERALRTAEVIATRLGQPVRVSNDLTEWELMERWSGVRWDDLDARFPGELEAYLAHPADLPFAPESMAELGERLAAAVRDLDRSHPHGDLVVVSHSASLRAATLVLTGTPLERYWDDTPAHASVTTLRPGSTWTIEATWAPAAEG